MKQFLKVSGIILLIIAVIAACVYLNFNSVEKETAIPVTDCVNAISAHWDPAELKERADPGLIKAMSSQGQSVEELFKVYSKLGKPLDTAHCTLKNTTNGTYTSATYDCEMTYENGPATITITIRKKDDQKDWQIYYINIKSPFFMKLMER
jgi:hypothetical protein